MRYLTLAAELTGPFLKDISEGEIELESLELPTSLCDELRAWCDAYRPVIHMEEDERQEEPVRSRIEALDGQGLRLASRIEEFLVGAKVEYYSEGLLRRIWRFR